MNHRPRRFAPVLLITLLTAGWAGAADRPEPQTLPLWPEGAPNAVGKEPADIPSITVYRPDPEKATGASVVICPGGGYAFLADDHEGKQVADWLNSLGVTGVVLKYRIAPRYHHPAPIQDAQRAIRTVRARASEWGLDPKRVAILGFSAGGHLASTAGTHFDAGNPDAADPVERQSCRPDLMILGYPVIALSTMYGHTGSLKNLLGENPSKELVESLSNEKQVTKDTPPTFLVHTNEDKGVVPENSLLFALALRKAGVPLELHILEKGQHGLGLGNGLPSHNIGPNEAFKAWPGLCATWLKGHGFLDRAE
jgi:acetyl esterase/lipase